MDDPFIWGSGGARKTPEQIAREREIAQALIAQGADFSPVQSWTQGAARVANALAGVVKERRADSAEKKNTETDKGILASLLAGSSDAGAAVAQTAAPVAAVAPVAASGSAPVAASPLTGNKAEFVSTLMPAALEASKRTGVDPRIIIAQGALESAWGKSAPGNNLFGIKSHGQAGGNTLSTMEEVNGKMVRQNASFRGYASPADSVSGYADFISENPRYKPLREAQGLDAQIEALQASGYATDSNYGNKIRAIAAGLPMPNTATNAADAIAQQAPVQVASADPSFMPGLNAAAANPSSLGQYRGAGSTMSPEEANAMLAKRQQENANNPNIRPWSGPAEINVAQLPGGPQASITQAVPAMPSPQTVAPNPVPPQVGVERVAAALSPVQQAMQMDPSFDGFSQNTGSTAPGQPAIPAAPSGPQMAPDAPAVSGINPAIIQALNDPAASPQTQKIAMALLQQQMAKNAPMSPADQLQLQKTQLEIDQLRNPQAKPTADIQEYNFAKSQGFTGSFVDFQQAQKKAGAPTTNVTVGGGDSGKFFEAADKKRGEAFVATAEAGDSAQRSLAQITGLEQTLANTPTGMTAGLKQLAGQYGINTEGLDDIQAATATISGLIPAQRPPGSGTMSDGDVAMFKASLPSIMNSPGGNAKILSTMKAIAGYDMQRGQIANQVLNREITPAEGQKLMSQIPNPLEGIGKAVAPAAAATPAPGSYRWNPETNQLEPQ